MCLSNQCWKLKKLNKQFIHIPFIQFPHNRQSQSMINTNHNYWHFNLNLLIGVSFFMFVHSLHRRVRVTSDKSTYHHQHRRASSSFIIPCLFMMLTWFVKISLHTRCHRRILLFDAMFSCSRSQENKSQQAIKNFLWL